MQVVAIIQARMGSTRLPGKVLKDIGGKTMLALVVLRAQRAELLDKVVVATTVNPADEAVVTECGRLGVEVFRGEEEDVVDRYYRAAKAQHAKTVVRITSDCPLIDHGIVDKVIRAFQEEGTDYASNSLKRTYPRGLDAEVMTMAALEKAWKEAGKLYERVHVTPYIYLNPGLFKLLSVTCESDYSHYRWTVDTQEDLDFVQAVYARFVNNDSFTWRDVLALLEKEPELAALNRHIRQKNLEEG